MSGFAFVGQEYIHEHGISCLRYVHQESLCEVLHLKCRDQNKVFLIAFSTPPHDSSGLPHILEHSVLCGSRRYRVKEPFRELLKGSLNTFLNAFTYPDRTCYPVASYHLKDLLNLMEVYLDAVFHPLLTQEAFFQEGWHVSLKAGERPSVQGVVYNEMKGAYSSPEHLLQELSIRALFQGHPYCMDSGGDPRELLKIGHEDLLRFHRRYYCPRNARVILYGDMEPDKPLRLLDQFLSEVEPGISHQIPAFEGLKGPVFKREGFLPKETGAKDLISMSWLMPSFEDLGSFLLLRVIEEATLGTPGAPLRRKIVESGLCEDLVGEGLQTELKYLTFHLGAKGIEPSKEEEFCKFVEDTIDGLVRDGIPMEHLRAGLNRLEFSLREGQDSHLPKGLGLSLRALCGLMYCNSPAHLLKFERGLNEVKGLLQDRGSLKGVLRALFLDNLNKAVVVLSPEPNKAQEFREVEERTISLCLKDRWAYEGRYKAFEAYMSKLDQPHELARIPRLSMSEIPKQSRQIPIEVEEGEGFKVLLHELDTSGVLYLDLGMDLSLVAQEDLVLVPVLGRCLLEMGTKKRDISELSALIGELTGGFRPELLSTDSLKGEPIYYLFLRAKVLQERAAEFLMCLREILLEPDLSNRERFLEILREEEARLEERVVSRGHSFASLRSKAHLGPSQVFSESTGGISFLKGLRGFRERASGWEGLQESLRRVYEGILRANGLIINLTGQRRGCEGFLGELGTLIGEMKASKGRGAGLKVPGFPLVEGFSIPAQVFFVAETIEAGEGVQGFHGSWLCAAKYLRNAYLWEEVRMKGGAYGAFALVDRVKKAFTFSSYRDPNPANTIRCFEGAGRFLSGLKCSRDDVERCVIGTVGELDRHMEADEMGYVSMLRHLRGETELELQRLREEVLETDLSKLRALGDLLVGASEERSIKVLGPQEGLGLLKAHGLGVIKTESLL